MDTAEVGDKGNDPGETVGTICDGGGSDEDGGEEETEGEDVFFPELYCFGDGDVCLRVYAGFVEASIPSHHQQIAKSKSPSIGKEREEALHEVLRLIIAHISRYTWYNLIHLLGSPALRYICYCWREPFRFPQFPVEDPANFSGIEGGFVDGEMVWVEVPGDGEAALNFF